MANYSGGRLLACIDEDAALYTVVQLENPHVVAKLISEINFISALVRGDIIEIGIEVVALAKAPLPFAVKCVISKRIRII